MTEATPENFRTKIHALDHLRELGIRGELTKAQEWEVSKVGDQLRQFSEVLIAAPETLPDFLEYIERVELYKGKKRDRFTDGWVNTLYSLSFQLEEEPTPLASSTSDLVTTLIAFLHQRVADQPARTTRISKQRYSLWELLATLSLLKPIPKTLESSSAIAFNNKYKEMEQLGAISCLLSFWDGTDKAVEKLIIKLKKRPPSQKALSLILEHEILLDIIDQEAAYEWML